MSERDTWGRGSWRRLAALGALLWAVLSAPAGGAPAAAEPVDARASLVAAGKAALEDQLYDVARKQFEQCLARRDLTPEDRLDATLLLARALDGLGRHGELLAALGRLPSRPAGGPRGDEVLFWTALGKYRTGRTADALADLDALSARRGPPGPWAGPALRLKAACLLKAGPLADALAAYESFDREFGGSAEGARNLFDWASALGAADRTEEARRIFLRLFELHPASDAAVQDGRYAFGQMLARRKQWAEATGMLEALAAGDGVPADRRSEACYASAIAWEAQGDLDRATNAVARGLALAPTPELRTRGAALMGQLCLRLGQVDAGGGMLKGVVSANPGDPLAPVYQLRLAQAYLDAGNAARAAEEYQHYLETFTNRAGQVQALNGRGWALLNLGRYAEAASSFERSAQAATNAAERERALFKAGDAQFAGGQFAAAATAYERLLREHAQSALAPQARYQLCESVARAGRPEEAERRLIELADREPGSPLAERALLRAGELRREQGRLPEAAALFQRALQTYTNGALIDSALYSHGLVSYQLLRFPEALADFTRVMGEFPSSRFAEQAFYMRGWCFYMMGRDAEALAVGTNFLARFPTSTWTPEVRFWLGEYRYNHGAYEKAEAWFALVAEDTPKSGLADDARFWAGRSAFRLAEYRRAHDHFARLAKDSPGSPRIPEARFHQGEALSELGEFSPAILLFDEVIGKHASSGVADPAWVRKGDCQFTLGAKDAQRYQEALASYRVVAGRTAAPAELRIQAEYKIGRCHEKLGQSSEAFEQYYTKVICRYLEDAAAGRAPAGADVWFTRAAFNAADLMEAERNWRRAIRVLERVVEAAVPASADAQVRIDRIRKDHWVLY